MAKSIETQTQARKEMEKVYFSMQKELSEAKSLRMQLAASESKYAQLKHDSEQQIQQTILSYASDSETRCNAIMHDYESKLDSLVRQHEHAYAELMDSKEATITRITVDMEQKYSSMVRESETRYNTMANEYESKLQSSLRRISELQTELEETTKLDTKKR
jgi:exonuclease VII large subunit